MRNLSITLPQPLPNCYQTEVHMYYISNSPDYVTNLRYSDLYTEVVKYFSGSVERLLKYKID
jgi:hypothetical protein